MPAARTLRERQVDVALLLLPEREVSFFRDADDDARDGRRGSSSQRRLPSASPPGQSRAASVSLTIATAGRFASSPSLNARPKRSAS